MYGAPFRTLGTDTNGEGDLIVATLVRREDYFDAAIEILSTDDHGGLKQAPLCRHLSVTTGSFYNYFESWGQFKTEFLQHWLDQRTLQLVDAARLVAESEQRLELLIEFACALPHRAESAIRAWAHSDPEVRAVQNTVDEQRFEVVLEATTGLLGPGADAENFARMGLLLLYGYQQSMPQPELGQLRWALQRTFSDALSVRAADRPSRPTAV